MSGNTFNDVHKPRNNMDKIAPSFIAAKREFLPATKDKNNPHYKSKYADLGSCFDAVDDAMLKNDIAIYQETFEDDSGVTVETVFLHSSGQTLRGGKLHVPASKQDPQGYGSALTYARRYSLMTACGIAPEDDDGNSARPLEKKTATPVTNKEPAKFNESNAFDDLEGSEFAGADLAVIEQFKACNDIAELTKIMNSIKDKKPFVESFNKRMTELKASK